MSDDKRIHIFERPLAMHVLPHVHDCMELVYVSKGSGVQTVNGKSRSVSRGDLLFYNIGELHCLNTSAEIEAINIQIHPQVLDGSLASSGNAIDLLTLGWFHEFSSMIEGFPPKVSFQGKVLLEVESVVLHMLEEYREKNTGSFSVIFGYMNVLLAKLFRQICIELRMDVRDKVGLIAPDILAYIETNYKTRISVQELARKCFYNPSYFVQVFKECFGTTPLQYINRMRVAKAMEMLETGTSPVDEIMRAVGYSDKKHFYSLFRQATGLTPARFRETRQNPH
jgi:AraC family transcriptional regulator, L-rhamnose operon transcriptional activator RhaR